MGARPPRHQPRRAAGDLCRRHCRGSWLRWRVTPPSPRANTHSLIATKRSTVTARFAAVSTTTSSARLGDARACSSAQRPGGRGQAGGEDRQPLHLMAYDVPRTAHAEGEPPVGRRVGDRRHQQRREVGPPRRHRRPQRRGRAARRPASSTRRSPGRCRPACRAGRGRPRRWCDPAARRSRAGAGCPGPATARAARPRAGRRCAVRTMSTLLSGSSTQSTGTSWIRSPARSATTSSSVSKNHALSSTSGSSSRAASRRIALKPHWASLNRARSVWRSSRL